MAPHVYSQATPTKPRAWGREHWEEWAQKHYPQGLARARQDYPNGAEVYCEKCLPDPVQKGTRRNPIMMDLIDCAIALEKGWPVCSDHGTMRAVSL